MKKYDYYLEVTNDVECWLDKYDDPFDISQFENREEAIEFLIDELWAEDSITGNGSYSYADEKQCEEYLCHNIDLIIDACDTFGVGYNELRKQYKKGTLARYLDCTIRCYVLSNAIEGALITWEGYGFRYKNKSV